MGATVSARTPPLSEPVANATPPSTRLHTWLAGTLLVVAGVVLAWLQQQMAFGPHVSQRVFPAYLAGESQAIFNARVLMREVLRWLWDVTGASPIGINHALQTVAAVAALLATRAFARRWLSPGRATAAAVLAGGWVVWGFARFTDAISYPYDLPAFAFSAAGLAAIVWGRYAALAAVIAVGTFNKETTFWLVPACFFWTMRDRASWRDRGNWVRVIGLALLFLAAYQVPRLLMATGTAPSPLTVSLIEMDPGAPAPGSYRAWQNFRLIVLLKPMTGFPWIHVALSIHLLAMALWSRVPKALRQLLAGALFFYLPIMFVGNVWELRIFNEVLPLAATSLLVAFGGSSAPVQIRSENENAS